MNPNEPTVPLSEPMILLSQLICFCTLEPIELIVPPFEPIRIEHIDPLIEPMNPLIPFTRFLNL